MQILEQKILYYQTSQFLFAVVFACLNSGNRLRRLAHAQLPDITRRAAKPVTVQRNMASTHFERAVWGLTAQVFISVLTTVIGCEANVMDLMTTVDGQEGFVVAMLARLGP